MDLRGLIHQSSTSTSACWSPGGVSPPQSASFKRFVEEGEIKRSSCTVRQQQPQKISFRCLQHQPIKPLSFKLQLPGGTQKKKNNNNNEPYNRSSELFALGHGEYASSYPIVACSQSFFTAVLKELDALYRFSRPHTVIGTVVGITCICFLPIESSLDLSPEFFLGVLKALVPSVFMNIYVVGLNQLYDVEIDKVNKPHLPLASGEYSMETGSLIVFTCFLLSFASGFMSQSPAILVALIISFMLGSIYSIDIPLLRWKRQAFLAATCITIVRALIIPFAFFIHIQKYVLHRSIRLTRSVLFTAAFTSLFVLVISLFKDIPDIEGDEYFGIHTLTVRLGKEKVFWTCIKLLLIAYGASSVFGASSTFFSSMVVTVVAHSALAIAVWVRAKSVDLASNVSIHSFYMFIWKLFYVEYVLIPFVR